MMTYDAASFRIGCGRFAPMKTSDSPTGGVTPLLVLGKITQILDAFSADRSSLTLGQLRAATGLPASTVQRLVANMVWAGLLERHDDQLRIGLRMAYWAAPAIRAIDAITVISPLLDDLRDLTGESVTLFRVEQGRRVCVALSPTRHELRQEAYVGRLMPLHAGSAGRVLLAWDTELEDPVLARDMQRLTGMTITERDDLDAALAATRAQGYAVTSGERIDGAAGLSAPIFDDTGRVLFSLTISGPAIRITDEAIASWTVPLVEAARDATQRVGGRAPATYDD